VIVAGFWSLLVGLVLFGGGRLGLPRGPYAQDEAKRKAVRQSAWVLITMGAAGLALGLASRA
jgi:hypothetical protein